jgi:hypothetical protein
MQLFGKVFILAVACAPIIWLSWIASAPSGERSVSWTPGEFSSFITSPLPGDRVSAVGSREDGDAFVTLTGEPTYIGVFPPSEAFTSAEVSIEFDPHDAYAFEIGGLTNVAAYAFDFRALSNAAIESLTWPQLPGSEGSDVLVFARQSTKASVQDFLNHPPARTAIVTYRATLPGMYRDSSYVPLRGSQTFDVSLRGSHEYVTYLKDEAFRLSVTYQDINRTFGADEGYIRVLNEAGTVMASTAILDDENISEDQTYTTKTATVSGGDWPEGVYRVELSGTSDIVWRTFVTNQRYMAFKNRLFIADDVGYLAQDRQTHFVTNSKSLVFETLHVDSAHGVTLGSEVIEIPLPHTKVRATLDADGVVEGVTDAGDVKMTGEGKFALSRDAFFDPDARSLTAHTNLHDGTLAYLVANVPSVEMTSDGWRTASARFDLSALVKESGAYKFALSLPGLVADGETVDIHRIHVTFRKEPISVWTAVYQELRAWKRAVEHRLW